MDQRFEKGLFHGQGNLEEKEKNMTNGRQKITVGYNVYSY